MSRRADVNQRSHDGMTPLAIAAFWGYADIVRLLLENGYVCGCYSSYLSTAWPLVLTLLQHSTSGLALTPTNINDVALAE